MAVSYIDTDKVLEISDTLNNLSNDLKGEINSLYSRLSNVPTETKEWVGDMANLYFNQISLHKKKYIDFASKINDISKVLKKCVSEVNSHVNSSNRLESDL